MKIAIVGGNVFDPESRRFESRDLFFEDSAVAEAGPSEADQVIDASGLYVLPGLIDLHSHLTLRRTFGPVWGQARMPDAALVIRGVRAALAELRRGVTTVRELAAKNDLSLFLRKAVDIDAIPGPDIFPAGAPLSITGGHACALAREVDGPDDIRRAVRRLAKNGAAWVKMFASNDPLPVPVDGQHARPEFTAPELEFAVSEAHHMGLRVTAHAMGTRALEGCIDAGIDSIEHGVYLDARLAERMRAAQIALIPTVSGYVQTLSKQWDRGDEWVRRHEYLVAPHRRAVEEALGAGVTIGVGSDTVGDYVEELQYLVDLGMTVGDVLRAATLGNAEILGLTDRGILAPGKRGDAVIVGGDPVESLEHIRDVRWVAQRGRVRRPSEISMTTEDESAEWNTLPLALDVI